MTTDPTTAIYDAIDAFQRMHRLPGLQHAQIRHLLAEHLARALPAAAPVPPPADRATLVELAAQAIRDSNGTPEALAWWKAHPQLIPAHVYAEAVLAVLPEQTDRATLLREAALNEAAAAIQDVIDTDRARFPQRSNDRAALGAARQIVLGLLGNPSRLAAEQPTETQDGGRRETVEYFVQSQQPDGTWESAGGPTDDLAFAGERLASRRRMMPDFVFRLAERTTAVNVRALPDCLTCRHWSCTGTGPCGALLDAWQRCSCPQPAVGERPDTQTSEALCRCGHGKDRHAPDVHGTGTCADCPDGEERLWRHPFTPAP
ncbi:hypothetical protein ABT090_20875 [Streptomyces asoensis]|uniref:hypothetical protein n=1 Tax=Streptomyces asoensis TaxID=249586 RepID=UPI00331CB64A